MFWSSGFHSQSTIDGILEKDEFTLEELLDDESVLQEVKSMNNKLLDYVTQPPVLLQLVDYITTDPNEELSITERFKYPNVACEVLVSDVQPISTALVESTEALERLWGALASDTPLNPLLASFVAKTLSLLLDRGKNQMLAYMKQQPSVLESMLGHLDTPAMGDLLVYMARSHDTSSASGQPLHAWLSEQDLIRRLIDQFHPDKSPEVHTTAARVLVDIASEREDNDGILSGELSVTSLTSDIYSDTALEHLIELTLANDTASSILLSATSVLNGLFRRRQISVSPSTNQEQTAEGQAWCAREKEMSRTVVNALLPYLERIKILLKTGPPYSIELTNGILTPPVGTLRLSLVSLLAALLQSNLPEVFKGFREKGILPVCLDLFLQFDWCNCLHFAVVKMVSCVCTNAANDGEAAALYKSLLEDCRLDEKIIEYYKANEEAVETGKGSLGAMGHVMAMGAALKEVLTSEKTKDIAQPHPSWPEFAEGPLTNYLAQTKENLGGQKPLAITCESDDDMPDLAGMTAMELGHYLCQQFPAGQFGGFRLDAEDQDGDFAGESEEFAEVDGPESENARPVRESSWSPDRPPMDDQGEKEAKADKVTEHGESGEPEGQGAALDSAEHDDASNEMEDEDDQWDAFESAPAAVSGEKQDSQDK